ncbi:MAG: hypothetical protein ACO1O6_07425 [Bacteroidota bacterium]
MKKFVKITKFISLLLLIINLALVFYGYNLFTKSPYIIGDKLGFKENYREDYFSDLKTMKDLNKFLHRKAYEKKIPVKSFAFMELASDIVRMRFYYNGYAFYNADEDIVLYLLGKFVWDDFAAIVIPDDIMKKEHAACSQQSIVLMELYKMNGLEVRKVGLNKHFALEARYKQRWYFFDPTFEPSFKVVGRSSLDYLMKHKDTLYKAYRHIMTPQKVDWRFARIKYGKSNRFPARKMLRLHQLTHFYTDYIFLISLVYYAIFLLSKRKLERLT